jgi:16S rRNA (uracil1498-N3)-methyltransferase
LPDLEPGLTTFPLPPEELRKLRDVLRLRSGAEIAVLPNDGTVLRCRLSGRQAELVAVEAPATEAARRVTIAIAHCRPEALEQAVRMTAELGVHRILLFPSDRSVVRWSEEKLLAKLGRLRAIAREASEVAFRVRLPQVDRMASLDHILEAHPTALVLSESERVERRLVDALVETEEPVLVIGPEGGWSPQEGERIAHRAVTLGPRVLRVDTAAVCALTLALYGSRP